MSKPTFTAFDAIHMQANCDRNRKRADFVADAAGEPVALESDLHESIMKYCDRQWPRWKYIRARMDKKSTMQVGCQDFTIFARVKIDEDYGARVFCIECKARNEKPSPEQLAWHKEMEMVGFTVHVVRSMDEFLEVVNAII